MLCKVGSTQYEEKTTTCWQERHTYTTEVACEAILLEYNLVAVGLKHWKIIRRLSKNQTSFARFAFKRRLVIYIQAIPDFSLHVPAHNGTPVNRPAELNLAKVTAVVELIRNIDLLVAVAGDAIWHDEWLINLYATDESCLEGRTTVVEDQGVLRLGRRRGLLRLAPACHCGDDTTDTGYRPEYSLDRALIDEVGRYRELSW